MFFFVSWTVPSKSCNTKIKISSDLSLYFMQWIWSRINYKIENGGSKIRKILIFCTQRMKKIPVKILTIGKNVNFFLQFKNNWWQYTSVKASDESTTVSVPRHLRQSLPKNPSRSPNPGKIVKPETVKEGKPVRKSSFLPPKAIRDILRSQRNAVPSTVTCRKLSEISENVNSSIVELPVTPEPKERPSITLSSELAGKLDKFLEDFKEFLITKEKSPTSTDCQRPTVIMSRQ